MGKKKQSNTLGKSVIRERFGHKARNFRNDCHLHTSEIGDGYDWNRINLRSVTEETSLEEFLATAELAGTEFTAEKLNIKFVSQDAKAGILDPEEEQKIKQAQDEHRQFLKIPRRPPWNATTSSQQLDQNERESFLEWRRELAQLQDVEGLLMTPFERNLDFWRQLWRVIERSDIVVQIVDARNPLLFRSEDLESYVKELDPEKLNMLLINKADYLSQTQREMWARFFDNVGLKVAFWSAVLETERIKQEEEMNEEQDSTDSSEEEESDSEDEDSTDYDSQPDAHSTNRNSENSLNAENTVQNIVDDTESDTTPTNLNAIKNCDECDTTETESLQQRTAGLSVPLPTTSNNSETSAVSDGQSNNGALRNNPTLTDNTTNSTMSQPCQSCDQSDRTSDSVSSDNIINRKNDPTVLDGPHLIEFFKEFHIGKKQKEGVFTVGLVGYPNVGKSSTINALLQTKKVPVSATPGRTKHFQTLFLEPSLVLCDCPGLVMPMFVNTKAEMVINGILPIDQMRDYVSPIAQVAKLIPRRHLEAIYGIMIAKPKEGENENRPPTAHELLSAYGFMRGFMTHKGIPDFQRSSRHILKDFVCGKLLYCMPPTDVDIDIDEFCPTPAPTKAAKERSHPQTARVGSRHLGNRTYINDVDRSFFEQVVPKAGTMGVQGKVQGISDTGQSSEDSSTMGSSQSLADKPWRKHHNKGKKEKLRRLHSYLDA